MKAYFTAALRGKANLLENYREIVKVLKSEGYKVFDQHIMAEGIENRVVEQSDEERKKVYAQLVKQLKESDVVVAEISTPSVSVGHEISFALEMGKVVIVLHTEGNSSILLEGSDDKKLKMTEYNVSNLPRVLAKALDEARKEADVRFNFFVSPKILQYLDWVAQKRMIPRSVFLRDLIEHEMKKDKEFKA